MSSQKNTISWYIDFIWLSVCLTGLFFTLIGYRALFVPDEGRYAEIAREMFISHDWVTPYLNGIKYFEKPPLFYWLGAIAFKFGGVTIFAARFINASFGIVICLATYTIARLEYNRATGILAACILATMPLFTIMTRMITLDATVTCFITLALYSFYLAERYPRYYWPAGIVASLCIAGAVLTKGLIGLVFPGLIACVWLTLSGHWRQLHWRRWLLLAILSLVLITPWHLLVGSYHPEFFYFYFIEQHVLRYLEPDVGHYQPAWFFLPVLCLGCLPWIIYLPLSIKKFFTQITTASKFFLSAFCIILLFFSFSKSKLIPYILPALPFLAIIIANGLVTALYTKFLQRLFKLLLVLQFICACALLVFTYRTHAILHLPNGDIVSLICQYIAWWFFCLSGLALTLSQNNKQQVPQVLILQALGLVICLLSALPFLDTRTIRPLADIILHNFNPQTTQVVTFHQYYQDLPFYLENKVAIVNWQNELSFGLNHQAHVTWMWNDQQFFQHWFNTKPLLVILSKDEFYKLQPKLGSAQHWKILGQTYNDILIENKPNNTH